MYLFKLVSSVNDRSVQNKKLDYRLTELTWLKDDVIECHDLNHTSQESASLHSACSVGDIDTAIRVLKHFVLLNFVRNAAVAGQFFDR